MDLFTYGTEPTSVVLRWIILCLVEYPEVQQKCHDEIDQVHFKSMFSSLQASFMAQASDINSVENHGMKPAMRNIVMFVACPNFMLCFL